MNLPTLTDIKNLQTKSEANDFVAKINTYLTRKDLSETQIKNIRMLRQKIYDRKKNLRDEEKTILPMEEKKETLITQTFTENKIVTIFPKKLQHLLIYGVCAVSSAVGIYLQSLQLYEATQLPNVYLCSLLTILLSVGFPIIFSITRSKLAFSLCIYVYVYEVILIVFGTAHYDKSALIAQSEQSEQVLILKDKLEQEKLNYESVKEKYNNPSSSTYHNAWYKEKMLLPSLDKYESIQKQIDAQKKSDQKNDTLSLTILKILFRLGLVALCMLSVHFLLK